MLRQEILQDLILKDLILKGLILKHLILKHLAFIPPGKIIFTIFPFAGYGMLPHSCANCLMHR